MTWTWAASTRRQCVGHGRCSLAARSPKRRGPSPRDIRKREGTGRTPVPSLFREAGATRCGACEVQRRVLARVGDPFPFSAGWRNKMWSLRSRKRGIGKLTWSSQSGLCRMPARPKSGSQVQEIAEEGDAGARRGEANRGTANRAPEVKQRGTTAILCTYMG